jgi:hypothetical protein
VSNVCYPCSPPLLLKLDEPGHINGSMYSFLSMWDGKT